jgi:hypothetical protein
VSKKESKSKILPNAAKPILSIFGSPEQKVLRRQILNRLGFERELSIKTTRIDEISLKVPLG